MLELMKKRFTSRNLQWEMKWGGFSFTKDEEVCQPTQLMHSYQKVTVLSPTDRYFFYAEKETLIWDAIKVLTGPSLPAEIFLLPAGLMEAKVSLPVNFEIDDQEVCLFSAVPSVLGIGVHLFALGSHQASCIAVLTTKGIYVLRRDPGMTVADVITILKHHLGQSCTHLVGMLGEKHQEQTLCPNAVIARDVDSASDGLQIFDYVAPKIQDGIVTFNSSHDALREFTGFLVDTGLAEMMPAIGWNFVTDIDAFIHGKLEKIMMVKKPSSLSLSTDEAVFSLAVFLFLCKVRTWTSMGSEPNIRCRIKMLHVWIWDAMISIDVTLARFSEEWERICKLFKMDKPWRFVSQGKCLNPFWSIGPFATQDDDGQLNVKVYMQLSSKGGGPVKLRTSNQVTHDGNMRDLAEFERANFSAALGFVLQKVVDHNGAIARCDISNFLELEARAKDGYYVIKGNFETLRQFMHILRETGVEAILRECGWMITCHFINIYDPVKADIVIFRKPLATAVSVEFIRAVLRSSLVRIGMPRPVRAGETSVLTKIKLWGIVIFHDHLDRNMPLQDIVDVWEQSSTIVCDMVPIRLVGSSGNMNPDFPLRYYTRCNESNQTVATINFIVGLRGGGYVDKQPGTAHDHEIQQRNALATFLISQGADIQGCVKFIEAVVHGAGAGAIASILGQKQPAKRWEGLIQLAEALHVQIPDIMTRVSKAKDKIQSKIALQAKQLPQDIQVESLILQPGFLCNSDGTQCSQIPSVTPNSTGVVLISEEKAAPWLKNQAVISQDELALLVIGGKNLCENFGGQKLQIPVSYNGEPLIVQATLHNLGARDVTIPQNEMEPIPGTESQVISVTAFADECDQTVWSSIVQSPVKSAMKALLQDQTEVTFLAAPWGRSFQRNGKRVDPKNALSVQFHARVAKTDVRTLLRASGTSGVYTVPKSEDRQLMTEYQIVWIQLSKVELAVALSRCENHLGIVRSQKNDGKGRGIRFAKQHYASAYALLKPDSPQPCLVASNFLFKVAPTPVGTTYEQMLAWIGLQTWDAKPIRALSSTVWLCGAESRFDDIFVQWNESPVLIRWLNPKKGKEPVILAGTLHSVPNGKNKKTQEIETNVEATSEDPWKAWIENKGSSGLAQIPNQAKLSMPAVQVQQPRRLEAPIEDRFSQQQTALQEIRDKGEKDVESLRSDIAKLEKTILAQQQQVQYNLEMTNAEFKAVRAETNQQLQTMSSTFQESLQKALHQHDQQMYNQFNELKQLMMNKEPKLSPPQKKQKGTNMNEDDDNDAKL